MNLLRPVRRWIARRIPSEASWLEGLEITQEDIDHELLCRELEKPAMADEALAALPRLGSVTLIKEEIRA